MGNAIASAILTYKKEMISDVGDLVEPEASIASSTKKERETKSTQVVAQQRPVKNIPKTVLVVKNESDNTTKEVAKKPKKPENKKETVKVANKEAFKKSPNIIYKVQIFASSKNIPLHSENFKGLNTLSKEPYKNLYRYMYGNTDSHFQATLLKSNADAKGYTTSYIVAYKDGVRISETEALKYASE